MRSFSKTTQICLRHRKLEGKVALITGAASGIGKETATKFINHGAKVVIADIHPNFGRETAEQLGPKAAFIGCDVTKESDISAAVDYAVSKHGQLDIMYNNAGVACRTPPSIVDLDLEAFDRVMKINVRGVIAGVKHASRVMIPRRTGSIICTASVTGKKFMILASGVFFRSARKLILFLKTLENVFETRYGI